MKFLLTFEFSINNICANLKKVQKKMPIWASRKRSYMKRKEKKQILPENKKEKPVEKATGS